MPLVVQKYGGTSVGTIERIEAVAKRCLRTQAEGNDVVVCVSAMAGETNRLLELAKRIHPRPDPRETDVLAATGEQVSVALTALAIQAAGGKARSFLGDQIGMRTDDQYGRARILSVDDDALRASLARGEIAVVAGFQGEDEHGNITTLGRGGSDTTGVALAAALKADVCEIYTDVDGIYTTDPRICPDARKLPRIACEEMLELASLGAKVLQVRSVEFALNHDVCIHVRSSFDDSEGSWVVPEDELRSELQEEQMEDVRVRGLAVDKNCAKLALHHLPSRPGTASKLFRPLAERGVNVDVIVVAPSSVKGKCTLSFTVERGDLATAREIAARVAEELGGKGLETDERVAKVSMVGAGMRSHPGVAADAFEALASAGIDIQIVSTSEIKIACVVAEDRADEAIRVLHAAFGLAG
jgi:aspartate kinase